MIDSLFSNASYLASKQMLDATAMRQGALAGNIANADTPGYKRVDLSPDFQANFADHLSNGETTSGLTPNVTQDTTAISKGNDGNNVEIDKEMLAMSSNSLEYDTMTEFVSGSLKQLKMAITGTVN